MQFFSAEYLLNPQPQGFSLQTPVLIISVLLVISAIVSVWYLKKRREKFSIQKELRLMLAFHSKINVVITVVLFLLVLFRMAQLPYLSLRILPLLSLLALLINVLIAFIKNFAAAKNPQIIKTGEVVESYQKYLPKKKKK